MKRLWQMMIALGLLACMAGAAQASVYTWTPNPADLNDLDHDYYYAWGIGTKNPNGTADTRTTSMLADLAGGQKILSATLRFSNIYDWIHETDDHLYVHLLDNTTIGVTQSWDAMGGGDNFLNQGIKIGDWNDPNGDDQHKVNLAITLDASQITTFLSYLATISNYKVFGFGFDPDCHYFNDGISFEVVTGTPTINETSIVPEPATLSLMGLGLGIGGFIRRRRQAKS